MSDILRTARLIEVSSNLQTAANYLKQFKKGGKPNAIEEKALKWTGVLLLQIDWQSKHHKKGLGRDLAFQAATARPTFYDALIKISPGFEGVGINSDRGINIFLNELYKALESGGSKICLSPEKLSLAAELLQVLSESLIAELSNNGLPRQQTWLTVGAIA